MLERVFNEKDITPPVLKIKHSGFLIGKSLTGQILQILHRIWNLNNKPLCFMSQRIKTSARTVDNYLYRC